jgi:hypothetical protein
MAWPGDFTSNVLRATTCSPASGELLPLDTILAWSFPVPRSIKTAFAEVVQLASLGGEKRTDPVL